MKLIVAVIRPEKLERVVHEALDEPGASLLNVTRALDVGEPSARALWRGQEFRVPRPRLRLEVVVLNEALVSSMVRAIARAAATNGHGRPGDGDIVVLPMEEHLHIPIADPERWTSEEEDGKDAYPHIGLDHA